MSPRRASKKPVERLRSSWTSTDDLEETIAAMFSNPPVNVTAKLHHPPVNLSGAFSPSESVSFQERLEAHDPTDKLTVVLEFPPLGNLAHPTQPDPLAILTGPPPANMAPRPTDMLSLPSSGQVGHFGQTEDSETPADKLTAASAHILSPAVVRSFVPEIEEPTKASSPSGHVDLGSQVSHVATSPDKMSSPAYITLEGVTVDSKCVRPYSDVQSAHTPSEHLTYTTMWKMLGSRDEQGQSREGILPMSAIAAKISISVRNLRRVLRSLEQKFAIEVTEFEESTKSIPRRYRVWGFKATMDRRRAAGFSYVYRNRNTITLARHTPPPDNLTCADNLTAPPTDNVAGSPTDNMNTCPPDRLSAKDNKYLSNQTKQSSSDEIARLRDELKIAVPVDDAALGKLIAECRNRAGDCTVEEIAHFARQKARLARTNPIGLILYAVPPLFAASEHLKIREQLRREKQAREREQQQLQRERDEQRRTFEAILNDPRAPESDKQLARDMITLLD